MLAITFNMNHIFIMVVEETIQTLHGGRCFVSACRANGFFCSFGGIIDWGAYKFPIYFYWQPLPEERPSINLERFNKPIKLISTFMSTRTFPDL